MKKSELVRDRFGSPVRCLRALCADGRRRSAHVTGEADACSSLPARVCYRGATVTGFLCAVTGREGDLKFVADQATKDGHLIPSLPCAREGCGEPWCCAAGEGLYCWSCWLDLPPGAGEEGE